MKKGWFTVMLVAVAITVSYSQRSTKNNFTGAWELSSSWTGGQTVNPTAIGGNIFPVSMNGFIRRNGDLIFSNGNTGKDFFVNDTLVVLGSVTAGNNAANIRLGPNAILIILGDFNAENQITVDNGGILIITGNMNFKHNGQGEYEEDPDADLYVQGDVVNNPDAAHGDDNWDNLKNDYPELHSFVVCGGWDSCILPVKLAYFTAERNGDVVDLKWATTLERNFREFIVQRSLDGVSFEDICSLPGKGFDIHDVETRYAFSDATPHLGTNYYRLKAVDLDDTFEFFQVRMVRVEGVKAMNVYPNPSGGEALFLALNFYPDESDRVSVIDQLGVEVYNSTATSGDKIDFKERLHPGVYFVRYKANGFEQVRRVVVQR